MAAVALGCGCLESSSLRFSGLGRKILNLGTKRSSARETSKMSCLKTILYGKLENLENVFIGSAIQRDGLSSSHSNKLTQDYTTSTLMLENTELKKKIARLEEEKIELKQALLISSSGVSGPGNPGGVVVTPIVDNGELFQLRQSN